jgi:hypothetical protein
MKKRAFRTSITELALDNSDTRFAGYEILQNEKHTTVNTGAPLKPTSFVVPELEDYTLK